MRNEKFGWLMGFAGYAITHNLTPFISMQNHHSLLYREEEREMLPLLKVSPNPPPPERFVETY